MWSSLATEPIDIDTGVEADRARAIAAALVRRVLPLVVQRQGRAEPLASGALYRVGGQVALLTCRHIFDDGAVLGDLGVPLPAAQRVLWLRQAAARVIAHPQRDLALIAFAPGPARERLLQHWPAVPLVDGTIDRPDDGDGLYVLAGWPYAQMRRIDATVYARPVVVFAPPVAGPVADGAALRLRYARVARRVDGIDIHAPALDGVSGATLWAVQRDRADPGRCLLRPAAVQSACKHDAYARGEPLAAARAMFERIAQR